MRKSDAAVIGGGPSGLHVAKLLSQRGLDVVVLEKKRVIGADVICTGIIGKDVFEDYALPTDSILREIRNIQVVSSSGHVISYQHPSDLACIVDRKKFDQGLADAAAMEGATIEKDTRVTDISVNDRGVDIRAEDEAGEEKKYSAAMAILATGVDHQFNKKLGLGFPNEYLLGAQAEVAIQNESPTTVFVGKDVAPGAFAWAVPSLPGKVRIGLVTSSEPRACFQRLISRHYADYAECFIDEEIRVKPIAQGLVSRTYADRVIALGEAAGHVKTTTGGGISFGLLCARIAAELVAKCHRAGSYRAEDLSEYERGWKKAIQREILIGYYARKIYARLNDDQIIRLFELAQTNGIIPLIQEKGHFDLQSEVILALIKKAPVFSILKGFSKKPGALDKTIA